MCIRDSASTDNRAVIAYVILLDGLIIDTIPAPTTSKLVGGLKAETAYSFEVYAYDAAGNKSGKAENTVTTLKAVSYTHLDVYKRQHEYDVHTKSRRTDSGSTIFIYK